MEPESEWQFNHCAGGAWLDRVCSRRFTSVGGQQRNRIAALDAATATARSWDPNAQIGAVTALKTSGHTVYAGGDFVTIGGQDRWGLAALDADTGAVNAWNPLPNNAVLALAVARSTIYVGGQFQRIGGRALCGLAAINASTGSAKAWNPDLEWRLPEEQAIVQAIAVSGQTLYVGGEFTTVAGAFHQNFAAVRVPPMSHATTMPARTSSVALGNAGCFWPNQ